MPEFYDAWDDQIPTPVVGTRYLYCLVCIILHNQSKAVNLALHTKKFNRAYALHLMWIKPIRREMQSADVEAVWM